MKRNYISASIIFISALFLFAFHGCSKEMEVLPGATVEKQVLAGREDVVIFMMINDDQVLKGTEAAFYAFINGRNAGVDCGRISLQRLNARTGKWEPVAGAQNMEVMYGSAIYSISEASLADNGIYRWHYIPGGSCAFKTAQSGSLELVVVEELQ